MEKRAIIRGLGKFTLFLILFPGLPLLWAWYTFVGPGYWAEFKDVKNQLESIPGVEIKYLGYNEDITLEDIHARIQVKDKGTMTLYSLTRESFKNPKAIGLGQIGDFDIRYTGTHWIEVTNEEGKRESIKSNVSGFGINPIGDGGFAKMFPKEINNVQDLVSKYDEVLNVISKWPDVDNKEYFKDNKGNEYNYYKLPLVQ